MLFDTIILVDDDDDDDDDDDNYRLTESITAVKLTIIIIVVDPSTTATCTNLLFRVDHANMRLRMLYMILMTNAVDPDDNETK